MSHSRGSGRQASGSELAPSTYNPFSDMLPYSWLESPQFRLERVAKTCPLFVPGCNCALGMPAIGGSLGVPPVEYVQQAETPLFLRRRRGYPQLSNAAPDERFYIPSSAPELSPGPFIPSLGEFSLEGEEETDLADEEPNLLGEEVNLQGEGAELYTEGLDSVTDQHESDAEELEFDGEELESGSGPSNLSVDETTIVRPSASGGRDTHQEEQTAEEETKDTKKKVKRPPASCPCMRPDTWQNMIECEGKKHPGEDGWYHLECSGVEEVPPEEDPWFCSDCIGDQDPTDVWRRVGHGGKKLPGATSPPPPEPPAGQDKKRPEIVDLTGPAQRKRKADQASLGEPPKRRKINVAVGQELPGRFAPTNISPRKRKAEEDEEEEEVVVVQTAPKKRKIVILGYRRAQPAASAPQTPASPAVSKGRPWSADEESATIKIMQDLVAEGRVYGDKRWAECAKRLKKQQPSYRSAAAIKNQWNRVLRARSGVDERKHPNPSRMTTGSQTPKKRKRAQSVVSATATAAEDDLEEGEEVEEDDEMEEEVKDADEDKDEGQDEETRKVKNDWGNEDFALPRKRMLRGGREY